MIASRSSDMFEDMSKAMLHYASTRVGLSGTCLTVREDCSIVALQDGIDYVGAGFGIDFILITVRAKNMIEGELSGGYSNH